MAGGRTFHPPTAHSAPPEAEATSTARISVIAFRISVLVHPDRVLDEQVHPGGQAEHGAGEDAPRLPAVLAVEPASDDHAKYDPDEHLESDAGVASPVG